MGSRDNDLNYELHRVIYFSLMRLGGYDPFKTNQRKKMDINDILNDPSKRIKQSKYSTQSNSTKLSHTNNNLNKTKEEIVSDQLNKIESSLSNISSNEMSKGVKIGKMFDTKKIRSGMIKERSELRVQLDENTPISVEICSVYNCERKVFAGSAKTSANKYTCYIHRKQESSFFSTAEIELDKRNKARNEKLSEHNKQSKSMMKDLNNLLSTSHNSEELNFE